MFHVVFLDVWICIYAHCNCTKIWIDMGEKIMGLI